MRSVRSLPWWCYVALAAATVALGLWVHRGGAALGPVARDVVGDALWAAMMAWWLGSMAPGVHVLRRSVLALGICAAVELSQLVHSPRLDAVRGTTLGHLILGSGFDPRDLVAYALGVATAVLIELALRRWSAPLGR